MKAPFAVGEPVKVVIPPNDGTRYDDNRRQKPGHITFVTEVGKESDIPDSWPDLWKRKVREVGMVHVFGERYTSDEWGLAIGYRPLNPDDYEALRLKHGIPEKVTR